MPKMDSSSLKIHEKRVCSLRTDENYMKYILNIQYLVYLPSPLS